MKLVERFRRADENTLVYEFTVDDPATFTKPWTVQIPMRRGEGQVYEYACHEGNYAMENMLAGARRDEAAAAKDDDRKAGMILGTASSQLPGVSCGRARLATLLSNFALDSPVTRAASTNELCRSSVNGESGFT